jgi:hypothetical protein
LRRLFRQPLVLVVDALDECDCDSESAAVLGLLGLGATEKGSWLRVLLTSRPETPIRYGIRAIPSGGVTRFVLHEIEPPIVDHDIATYLRYHLRLIGTTFLRNPDWPSDEVVDRLVKLAGGLFIWAATAYRFIMSGEAFASHRLQQILSGASVESVPQQSLDRIYLTVLDKAVRRIYQKPKRLQLHSALHSVLAVIAVSAASLNINSLTLFAAISSEETKKALQACIPYLTFLIMRRVLSDFTTPHSGTSLLTLADVMTCALPSTDSYSTRYLQSAACVSWSTNFSKISVVCEDRACVCTKSTAGLKQ